MAITLAVCSWSLAMLGVAMTAWLYPHPLAFVPYLLLPLAITAARRLVTRAVILIITLCLVGLGFWSFWDAAFVHRSTLNHIPLVVAVIESLVAGVAWIVLRRVEKVQNETDAG